MMARRYLSMGLRHRTWRKEAGSISSDGRAVVFHRTLGRHASLYRYGGWKKHKDSSLQCGFRGINGLLSKHVSVTDAWHFGSEPPTAHFGNLMFHLGITPATLG